MRQDILKYVRELSLLDKKNLSQKALKLGEEVGELAKAVLPYDNAFGTNHRFVTPAAILEEVADTMLVALSIAYSLGYTDEDLDQEMRRKADYWAELQSREDRLTERTPYEIHVTVAEATNAEVFKEACAALEVKPIFLDLQLQSSEETLKDVMTSSVFFGKNSEAYQELQRIVKGLTDRGLHVVRQKIETVPWHPAAPSRSNRTPVMPPHCYFECHFAVLVSSEESREKLEHLAHFHLGCHLSKNVFKRLNNGRYTMMMTYRNYHKVYEDVQEDVSRIKAQLKANDFELDKSLIEFSIFDTKVSHDTRWVTG